MANIIDDLNYRGSWIWESSECMWSDLPEITKKFLIST